MPLLLSVLLACTASPSATDDSGPSGTDVGTADNSGEPSTAPWTRSLASLDALTSAPRGHVLQRAIVHLHSPWSHDACDGEPLDEDGQPRRDCLADLRDGLCDAGIDHAFLTDHPSHFATGEWGDVLLADADSTLLPSPDDARVLEHACADGRRLRWYPGVEDDLMPVGLDRHVPGDAAQRDTTYNGSDADTLAAYETAGATTFAAHTEGRDVEQLRAQVAAGLAGVEVFNLHAAFDPRIRSEDLGLDASSWLTEIAPFTSDDGTAEPDLFVLAVLGSQSPSEAAWDALNVDGPDDRVVVGVAGTDAHQNVFPIPLRDGERGDSYRRMLRWFSQHLWMDPADTGLDAAQQTLAAGRFHVVFEILGTPTGFDFHLVDAAGDVHEMGSVLPASALPAELVVECPTLAAGSPRGTDAPEITATVYRDGEAWQTGCGRFPVDDAGSFRVRVDMVPWHLAPFLGDDAAAWMRPYPWVYGNPVRIRP